MFDYRAHYESQPSVSVDFLRVVQLRAVADPGGGGVGAWVLQHPHLNHA